MLMRAVGVDPAQADLSREIAVRLRDATRLAAERSDALFVDMGPASAGHDACSPEPWVNGAAPSDGAAFHPTAVSAQATAAEVFKALSAAGLAQG